MKKITCFFLVLLALVFIFPVLFLVVGSLMGKNELTDLLFPVLQEGAKGYASWKLFPEYPTLKHYVEVLLDSPEFFVMFWNSVKITVGALAGGLSREANGGVVRNRRRADIRVDNTAPAGVSRSDWGSLRRSGGQNSSADLPPQITLRRNIPPVLTREVFCSSIHDDSAIDRHAQFFPDGGEMPEEIWSRSHSRFDLYEGGATALRSVYEVDFALVGIAVEVQLAVFVLVEVSLHGF